MHLAYHTIFAYIIVPLLFLCISECKSCICCIHHYIHLECIHHSQHVYGVNELTNGPAVWDARKYKTWMLLPLSN